MRPEVGDLARVMIPAHRLAGSSPYDGMLVILTINLIGDWFNARRLTSELDIPIAFRASELDVLIKRYTLLVTDVR